MLSTPTLICIPDISGFTEFMSRTDIDLSAKVITSLLNKIIYANDIGLKLSEIEGDAVLFYSQGELPSLEALIEQCKHFYLEFYKQLEVLQKKFKNHPESKNITKLLGLKIIIHYGQEIRSVPIGKNIKLMGEDVITAHRLLKNKVPVKDYVLFSETLWVQFKNKALKEKTDWSKWKEKETIYAHIGEISYHYINLAPLIAS